MKNNTKKLDNYLVAYIDILGGKELILNDKDNINLNIVKEIYKFAIGSLTSTITQNATKNLKIKIFSDNIVIASKIKIDTIRHIKLSIINFLRFIAYFQRKALDNGILLRGGVSYGELYIKEDFIWGKALIAAYEAEKKAEYPVIEMDEETSKYMALIKQTLPSEIKQEFSIMDNTYWGDCGKAKIDYLSIFTETPNMKHYVKVWQEYIQTSIQKHRFNEKILEKLQWQIKYHNDFCFGYKKDSLSEFIINEDDISTFLEQIETLKVRLGVDMYDYLPEEQIKKHINLPKSVLVP